MRTKTLGALATILCIAQTVEAARVFFTDQPAAAAGSVNSVAPDGTDQRILYTAASTANLRGIAWHRASGRVFFLDNGVAKAIFAMSDAGSNVQQIVGISTNLLNSDLEVDEVGSQMYWTECNTDVVGNGFIRRANLDGSGVETVVTTAPGITTAPDFLFLDRSGGYLYWGVSSTGSGPSSFWRATWAGVIDPLWSLTTATRTRDLGRDPVTDTLYWCDRQMGTIYKRSVTGGVNQAVISGMNAPHGLALDVEAGKLYWADTGARGSGAGISSRRVARCNLDGSEFENLSVPAATSEVWDLALDTASPTYAAWRTRFFSTSTPAAGPTDDADADGAPNLLEYALGTHPRRAGSLPRIAVTGAGMQYTRRRSSDLQYRVEVSSDLATWHSNQDGSGLEWTTEAQVTVVDTDYETVAVTAGAALGNAAQVYFRVRVAMP
jgi:hypothetical protein